MHNDAESMLTAIERGQSPELCSECGGLGDVLVGIDPDVVQRCRACGGSRLESGPCSCGYEGVLCPDLATDATGHAAGAVLVCPRCAVTCYARGCGLVSTVCDAETREQYCDEHWALEVRAYASMIAAMN